jgi:hypothetical protein
MRYKYKNFKSVLRSILLLFILTIMVILGIIFIKERCTIIPQTEIDQSPSYNVILAEKNMRRESITFILGEDREKDNPYYTEAINYYLHNEEGRTEYLVTECRSLLEVRDYLSKNPPSNSQPWGLINLVSHGNQWIGLSARVAPDSKRASTEIINEYIKKGLFPEVPDSLLDSKSELFIHGCGIGKNKSLVQSIQNAFGGKTNVPNTTASELYEYYTSVKYDGVVQNSERYQAETWSVCYKMGYKPGNAKICRMFEEKYPHSAIDWNDALNKEQPRWTGDIYHYTFEVPVKWVIPYPDKDSMPDVSTKELQLNWIRSQENICSKLEKIDIPLEKFNWWFRTVYVNNEDGTRSPAIWLKGYCTILIVIKPILDDEGILFNT